MIENCLLTFLTVIGSDIRDNFAQNVSFYRFSTIPQVLGFIRSSDLLSTN